MSNKPERVHLLDLQACEAAKLGPTWRPYRYEWIGGDSQTPSKLMRIDGAIAPLKTRGKYIGLPNWKLKDKTTERAIYITPAEFEAWREAWAERTGYCYRCTGVGEIVVGWSAANGQTLRQCAHCGGSGLHTSKASHELQP